MKNDELKFQLRLTLDDAFAERGRRDPQDRALSLSPRSCAGIMR